VSSIWALALGASRTPFPLGRSGVRENQVTLSHDGRLIAFESDESGATEVYVAPFGQSGRRRVSSAGGFDPRWRGDGREVFYVTRNGDVMSAAITGLDPLEVSAPVRMFRPCGPSPDARPAGIGWLDVSTSGTRFLVACSQAGEMQVPIVVSVDWAASLK
jgi:Tol biopolymer transport system component